jgi:hypothetical protein
VKCGIVEGKLGGGGEVVEQFLDSARSVRGLEKTFSGARRLWELTGGTVTETRYFSVGHVPLNVLAA